MDLEALKRKAREKARTRRFLANLPWFPSDDTLCDEVFDDVVRALQPELTRLCKIERTVRIGIERGEAHIATCPEDHDHGYIEAAVVSLRLAIVGTPICNVGEAPPVVSPTEEPT